MMRNAASFRSNAKVARQLWGEPSRIALRSLRELTARYSLSVAAGDLRVLGWSLVCNSLRAPSACFPAALPWNQYDASGEVL